LDYQKELYLSTINNNIGVVKMGNLHALIDFDNNTLEVLFELDKGCIKNITVDRNSWAVAVREKVEEIF
jgi:hypothetical protein